MLCCVNSWGHGEDENQSIHLERPGNIIYSIQAKWIPFSPDQRSNINARHLSLRLNGGRSQIEKQIKGGKMRQESWKWRDYKLLREEVTEKLPKVREEETRRVKEAFLSLIPSRRRYDRIASVADLILELEEQLEIFPEKKGIKKLDQCFIASSRSPTLSWTLTCKRRFKFSPGIWNLFQVFLGRQFFRQPVSVIAF